MRKSFILVTLVALTLASCSELERKEKHYVDAMTSDNYEDVYKAYDEFADWLEHDSTTMNYDFNLTREKIGMKVQTSADHQVRCYSWVTNGTGQVKNYVNVVQWKDGAKFLSYCGPLDAMLTGRKPQVDKQWSVSHSIDSIIDLNMGEKPIYMIFQSFSDSQGLTFYYVSAVTQQGIGLANLPFFFDGIETAGNRGFINDGSVNMAELIKWDAKSKKLYAYLTDDNNKVIPGQYETYVLGKDRFTKLSAEQ